MIDFGALPPEINSTRMHFGLGSETLAASAAAYQALAAEIGSSAVAFEDVTMLLAGESWTGPTSVMMVAAAAPYVAWLMACAAQCEKAGIAATNAALAFEAARALHIHPTIIAENRSELMALIATNFLGVNTPAIAANEAVYSEFWAQDASAMFGYAADATGVVSAISIPEMPPVTTVNPAGVAAQAASVADSAGEQAGNASSQIGSVAGQIGGSAGSLLSSGPQLMGQIPQVLQSLTTPLGSMLSGGNMFGSNGFGASSLLGGSLFAGNAFGGGAGAGSSPVGASSFSSGGNPVNASMGRAALMGRLSAPASYEAMKEENAAIKTVAAQEESTTATTATPRGMMPMVPGHGGGGTSATTASSGKRNTTLKQYRAVGDMIGV
jgi:PPE-repeat protein